MSGDVLSTANPGIVRYVDGASSVQSARDGFSLYDMHTRRDYAKAALAGILARPDAPIFTAKEIAAKAWEIAEEMEKAAR